MPVVGKLGGRAASAATAQPGPPGRLALLVDDATGTSYLVDTGAIVSVIPYQSQEPASGPAITAADGKPIKCWGREDRVISAGNRKFQWSFLRAAVAFPIVGADFLGAYKLLVNLQQMQLEVHGRQPIKLSPPQHSIAALGVLAADPASQQHSSTTALPTVEAQVDTASGHLRHMQVQSPATAQRSTTVFPTVEAQVDTASGHLRHMQVQSPATAQSSTQQPDYLALLRKFPEVVNASKKLPKVKHKVQHFIETEGRPVRSKYRRLDPEKLASAKADFREMERQGIVRRSSSCWAAPLHMVRKTDGS